MKNFVSKGQVSVVCDGQFGSTGKGLLAAFATQGTDLDIATTNASANAGHWTKYKNGGGFCCRHLPTSAVVNRKTIAYLNAGSIINPVVLLEEMREIGFPEGRLMIHPKATVIMPQDVDEENQKQHQMEHISSTKQGVGTALAKKVMRVGKTADSHPLLRKFIAKVDLNRRLLEGDSVCVEIPQGFSLSYHSQFHPFTTSRQCTVLQGLADAQIGHYHPRKVAMSVRTYPIRVGNSQTGYSGDCYPDQEEIKFEHIGQAEERTTVTNKIRRIFTWSDMQFKEAILENGPDLVFLNFMNYLADDDEREAFIRRVQSVYYDCFDVMPELILGHGPNVEDVNYHGK